MGGREDGVQVLRMVPPNLGHTYTHTHTNTHRTPARTENERERERETHKLHK